jgi:hypothetical protein
MAALLESVVIDATEDSNPSTPDSKVKGDPPASPSMQNGQESKEKLYDPSMLFLLEMGTSLAIRDEESMRQLSAEVAGYCTEILRQRKHLHSILIERSLIYLLALKKRGHETVASRMTALIHRASILELISQKSSGLFYPVRNRCSKSYPPRLRAPSYP